MNNATPILAALVPSTLLALAAGPASAEAPGQQEPSGRPIRGDTMRAVDGGLELAIAIGPTESLGDVGDGMDADDLIGSANAVELQVGHRVTPHLALSFYSTAQGQAERSTASRHVYSGSAGLEADFHLRPRASLDPWIAVGAGVRAMLIDADPGLSILVGAELARFQIGLDLRATEDFAVGPVLGASASLYGAQKTPMADFAELSNKGLNWTLSAGIAGRYNLFGKRR